MLLVSGLKGLLCYLALLVVRQVHAGIGLKPLDFFRLKDEELRREVAIAFHPDEGLRLRESFEKKYGVKGVELVKILGEGSNAKVTF